MKYHHYGEIQTAGVGVLRCRMGLSYTNGSLDGSGAVVVTEVRLCFLDPELCTLRSGENEA